jgi:tetratricopeptide (TPR) repeat protein
MVWLTQVAFAIALGLVAARLTMLETLREPFVAVPGVEAAPGGPGPGTSVVLDLLCWLPALLVLIRATVDRNYRIGWSWAHILWLLLAIWAGLSVLWSADRFAAAVGASHLLAAAALMWAASQLVRSWLRVRLLTGLIVGLLLVHLAQGLIYRYVEWPDLLRTYEEQEPEILRQRGWEPDSFMARQFRNKITSAEVLGFSASPNTFAAVLVLLTVIAGGVVIQRMSDGDDLAWALGVAVVVPVAGLILYHTGSRTGLAVAMLEAMALAMIGPLRGWLARHHRLAWSIGLGGAALVIAAVAAYGLAFGTLFHDSLSFRWRYWIGAGRVFASHPLIGVGWDNFSLYYLSTRVQAAAEEIRDPHNFIVRIFVELGLVGGVLLLGWLGRAWWEMTLPLTPPQPPADARPRYRGFQLALASVFWIAAIDTGIVLVAGIDYTQMAGFVSTEVFKRLLYGSLLFGGTISVAFQSLDRQQLDDRPAPWMLYAMLVAVGGFLLHSLVDVALLEIGPLVLAALIVGAIGGTRRSAANAGPTSRRPAVIALCAVGTTWLAVCATLVAPLAIAQNLAALADAASIRGDQVTAVRLYDKASDTMPLNADYASRAAAALIRGGAPAYEVRAMIDRVLATNPRDIPAYLTRAGLALAGPEPDIASALAAYERALDLNPADLPMRIEYARLLARASRRADAAKQYQQVLDRNDQYHPDEPERLTEQQIEAIRRAIGELGSR